MLNFVKQVVILTTIIRISQVPLSISDMISLVIRPVIVGKSKTNNVIRRITQKLFVRFAIILDMSPKTVDLR